jgi:hypothetical protein
MLSGQSVDIRIPWTISFVAARVVSGVRRFIIPSSSPGPKRPQALPRGPSFWRGRDSKGGIEGAIL